MNPLLRLQYHDLTQFAPIIYEHETEHNGHHIKTQIFDDSGLKVLAVQHNNRIISLTIVSSSPAD